MCFYNRGGCQVIHTLKSYNLSPLYNLSLDMHLGCAPSVRTSLSRLLRFTLFYLVPSNHNRASAIVVCLRSGSRDCLIPSHHTRDAEWCYFLDISLSQFIDASKTNTSVSVPFSWVNAFCRTTDNVVQVVYYLTGLQSWLAQCFQVLSHNVCWSAFVTWAQKPGSGIANGHLDILSVTVSVIREHVLSFNWFDNEEDGVCSGCNVWCKNASPGWRLVFSFQEQRAEVL